MRPPTLTASDSRPSGTYDLVIPRGRERLGPLTVTGPGDDWTLDDVANIAEATAKSPAARALGVDPERVALWTYRRLGGYLVSATRHTDPRRLEFHGQGEPRAPF